MRMLLYDIRWDDDTQAGRDGPLVIATAVASL